MRLTRSDPREQTLLYAGNPEYPTVLVHVTPVSYGARMGSENPIGAGNQQERPSQSDWIEEVPPDLGHWVAGFVDGEGSFNVPIRREHDRKLPWRAGVSFNVSQIGRTAPELLRVVFRCGTVRERGDGVVYFEVTKPRELRSYVFPFFDRFALRGTKARDLEIFRQVTELIDSGAHCSADGLRTIIELRSPMNGGGKRRRSDAELLDELADWESSEAIRKAPS